MRGAAGSEATRDRLADEELLVGLDDVEQLPLGTRPSVLELARSRRSAPGLAGSVEAQQRNPPQPRRGPPVVKIAKWSLLGIAGGIVPCTDALAILLASENAFRAAGEAVQALGGAGYTRDWPVERYLRDAKLLDIGAGTMDVLLYDPAQPMENAIQLVLPSATSIVGKRFMISSQMICN